MKKIFLFLVVVMLPFKVLNTKASVASAVTYTTDNSKNLKLRRIAPIKVTMYHAVPGQTDDTPDIVADGTKFDVYRASELRWIALSRDLIDRWGGPFKWGDIAYVEIPGSDKSGFYKVKDTMNPRFTNRVDMLHSIGTPIFAYDGATLYKVDTSNLDSTKINLILAGKFDIFL